MGRGDGQERGGSPDGTVRPSPVLSQKGRATSGAGDPAVSLISTDPGSGGSSAPAAGLPPARWPRVPGVAAHPHGGPRPPRPRRPRLRRLRGTQPDCPAPHFPALLPMSRNRTSPSASGLKSALRKPRKLTNIFNFKYFFFLYPLGRVKIHLNARGHPKRFCGLSWRDGVAGHTQPSPSGPRRRTWSHLVGPRRQACRGAGCHLLRMLPHT